MTKLVFIVLPEFRDPEFFDTKAQLGDIQVDVASTTLEQITGAEGKTLTPNLLIDDIKAENYDGIAMVGGPGPYNVLYNYPDTTSKIVEKFKAFNSANKLVAAICISPIALAKAGLIQGKKVTCWDSGGEQKTEIEEAGATFTGEPVTVDGNIITANGPSAASSFGAEIENYFAGEEKTGSEESSE